MLFELLAVKRESAKPAIKSLSDCFGFDTVPLDKTRRDIVHVGRGFRLLFPACTRLDKRTEGVPNPNASRQFSTG